MTGYRLHGRGLSLGKGKIFLFFTASRPALVPSQLLIQWAPEAISVGVKLKEREADHSHSSSVEVKKSRAIPPLPHMSSWHDA
jgi:hypothetical protein